MKTKNSREAAFLALLAAGRGQLYLQDSLQTWNREESPKPRDFSLAQEIAYGTMRRKRTLQTWAEMLHPSLKTKAKERWILLLCLYQHFLMDKIPLHAITDEGVTLAKKFIHQSFAKFLNAFLRKLSQNPPQIAIENSFPSFGMRYSYPDWFVEELVSSYGWSQTEEILEVGNQPPKLMARDRKKGISEENPVIEIEKITQSPDYYIQNSTPVTLLSELCKQLKSNPKNILDLCAAPGGKSIALKDTFPNAKLTANDSSKKRLSTLKENFEKYGVDASIQNYPGEEYPLDQKFDLILIDAPCSNSGVLNKRPEARWRLSEEALVALETTQKNLIDRAKRLLNPGGQIWYLTCSILPRENEALIKGNYSKTILPNQHGSDGGFGCSLR